MTNGRIRTVLICLVAAAVLAPSLMAQIPTGTVQGRVADAEGQGLPGVVVSAASTACARLSRSSTSVRVTCRRVM